MDLCENIKERVSDYKAKLEFINLAMAEEMNKTCDQRHARLLLFLSLEKQIHSLTLTELEVLMQNSDQEGEENRFFSLEREWIIGDINTGENKDENTELLAKRTYRVVTWGGIGDALLITPTVRILKQQHPDCKIHVYCTKKSHQEALLNNKYIDRLLYLGKLKGRIILFLARLNLLKVQQTNYGILLPSLFYCKSATAIIGEMLGVKIEDPRLDCFLTNEEEREARRIVAEFPNSVAIQVTTTSTPNKHWPPENWENLIQSFPHCNFLQIGSANDDLIRGVIDLRGTSLRQAFGIVKEAKAFVGVDSIFAHAAAAFQKPAVVLFGATTPAVWGHPTSINLYRPPRCSPCIDTLGSGWCPYGRKCMSNITVLDVERALSSLITRAVE
jgi:ADP-heptose:LPS heptosyltransferase